MDQFNENIGSNPAKSIRSNAPIRKQLKNKPKKKGPRTSHIKVNEVNDALRKSRLTSPKVVQDKQKTHKENDYAITQDAKAQRRMERRTARLDQKEVQRALRENQREIRKHERLNRKEVRDSERYNQFKEKSSRKIERRSERSSKKVDQKQWREAKRLERERLHQERLERERIEQERILEERKNKVSRILGFSLGGVQVIASITFIILLVILNMLPMRFMVAIAAVLILVGSIPFVVHVFSKKKAIMAKILSAVMIAVLVFGSYFVFRTNETVASVTAVRNIKMDTMVVVVRSDDPAQTIEDARDYTFGTQQAVKGWDVDAAVADINQTLGTTVKLDVLEGLSQQAEALFNGDVQAIVYNDAFTGLLEDTHEGFRANTRVIFEHTITSDVKQVVVDDFDVQVEPFAVYISGIDQRGSIDTTGRSDVNIVMIVNPETHQILLISTPRDFWVPIPGISNGKPDKLTHAGIYGVQASIDTLAELYGVEIPFYVRINFTSFERIIDALGGVDVYSDLAFTTGRNAEYTVTVQQGYNHLNGRQALAFSRERKGFVDGDLQRGRNQQAVITAMIDKATSPAILTGATQILASIQDNMDTNMAMDQVQNLIRMQLHTGAQWEVISMSAEGTFASKICFSMPRVPLSVVVPDEASVQKIRDQVQLIMNGQRISAEETEAVLEDVPVGAY